MQMQCLQPLPVRAAAVKEGVLSSHGGNGREEVALVQLAEAQAAWKGAPVSGVPTGCSQKGAELLFNPPTTPSSYLLQPRMACARGRVFGLFTKSNTASKPIEASPLPLFC